MSALLLLLTLTTQTLVLRSGDRIVLDAPMQEAGGRVTFRSSGRLFSMAKSEVDHVEETTPPQPETPKPAVSPSDDAKNRGKLRLSEDERKKLLQGLESNHEGTPMPAEQAKLPPPSPVPTAEQVAQQTRDEWSWRNEAHTHEEAIQRAKEELQLLIDREERLNAEILSLISLGYKPNQMSYQTTELAHVREQIPYARLEVTRAERSYEQFRDDARRQGVLPGWLR